MKTQVYSMFALAAAAKLANAHATVFAAWINDEDQGLGNSASGYIRSPPSNSPITDVTSSDMACNVGGTTATAKTLEVKSGDKFTFEWHHNNRDSGDDIIASSHKGPVMVYMAPTEKGSAGSGWVKIAEEGYSGGTWAVDTLIANKGKHSITIPDVPAGEYLLRPEIIALHEGNRANGAQLYMECVQIKVTSDGSSTLPEGVSFPGAYTATDKGILFDIYSSFDSYPIPGPSVWDGASGSTGASTGAVKAETSAAASTPAATSAAAPVETSAAAETPATSAPATTAAPVATTSAAANNGGNVVTETAYTTEDVIATTFATVTAGQASATQAASSGSSSGSSSGTAGKYAQCGGTSYTGPTTCEDGWTCKEWNQWYSQCVASA